MTLLVRAAEFDGAVQLAVRFGMDPQRALNAARLLYRTPPAASPTGASGDGAPVGCLPPDPRPAAPQQTRTQR